MQFVDVQGQKFKTEELNETCMRLVNMGVATELKMKLMNERAVWLAQNYYSDLGFKWLSPIWFRYWRAISED